MMQRSMKRTKAVVYFFLIISFISSLANAKGVAIEPTSIIAIKGSISNVIYHNETDEDYILYSKVIIDSNIDKNCSKIPFLVSPPIRMIRKNSQANLGVIYLENKRECENNGYYFLSVSSVPKKNNTQSVVMDIPIVLTQNIPIVFN